MTHKTTFIERATGRKYQLEKRPAADGTYMNRTTLRRYHLIKRYI